MEQVTHGESEIAFSYAYDRNGYITGEIRRENGTTVAGSYAYDAAGQLTEFLQTTGYGERYAYDKAGNMTEKVLTGTDGAETTLAMKYNKGNQLTGMANGRDKIAYKYDKNGSMVEKTLSSQTYGRLTDSYAYNALDQLTEYVGYDGYRQAFTYDANGMRQSKSEAGDANRSTLEELLRGNVAGLPEIVEPAQSQTNADEADMPAGLEWATTEYLYDLTQEYYQVISETTTYANGTSATTAYAYGLERIAAYNENGVTRYVYDGRGSVAQAISAPVAGEAATSALPDISVQVQSFSYTAYGEQMGGVKVSGFTYNAEAYDAATGMLNLRARQYEPAVGRFSGKDMMRGYAMLTISIHRYLYTYNNPINWIDPDGMRPADKDEAAQFFVDKQPTPQAKKTNASRKLESYTNKLKSYTNTKNQSGQKAGQKQSKTIAQLSSDLKSAVGFANYNRDLLANSSALREFQKARNEVHQSIANLHREVGRKENGVSIEEYRSLCSTTFAGMSAHDIENITTELNRKGGVEKDYAAEYNKATAENYVPNLNDASSAFSDETGDYDVSLDFGLPTVKGYIAPVEQYEVDITEKRNNPADVKMPVSYLKSFIAQVYEDGATYSGEQTYKINDAEYDCVSLAGRAAEGQWFASNAFSKGEEIGTYVEKSFSQGTNQREVTKDMERYDGMQLCIVNKEGVFTHQAVYFTQIELGGVVYRDVIIDIRGKAYPNNATAEEERVTDDYNKKMTKINVLSFDSAYQDYQYAFNLRDIDYTELE